MVSRKGSRLVTRKKEPNRRRARDVRSGIMVLAFPITVVGANFAVEYERKAKLSEVAANHRHTRTHTRTHTHTHTHTHAHTHTADGGRGREAWR